MLMNNLDPEVAERPDDLVVYGGTGRAARSWDAFDAIVRELRALDDDETLLVQSGKPVGVFRTHEWAPRVLIANSNLVPRVGELGRVPPARGARPDDVRADDRGLVDLHRQPGHRPGDLRVLRRDRPAPLRRLAGRDDHPDRGPRRHGRRAAARGDDERRRRALRRGRSRAHPAAARDPLPGRAGRRPRRRDRPLRARPRPSGGRSASASPRNAAEVAARAAASAASTPTSSPTRPRAHDPLVGYIPAGLSLAEADELRERDPDEYVRRARASIAAHCFAMVGFKDAGAEVFDYGNSLRAEAQLGGFERAFDYPGFVPAYIRPLFCEGKGPFRWAALSGDPADIAATDRAVLEEFPDDEALGALDPPGRASGSRSRACRRGSAGSGYGERAPPRAALQRDGRAPARSARRS